VLFNSMIENKLITPSVSKSKLGIDVVELDSKGMISE